MRYMGGKARIAKQLASFLCAQSKYSVYVEPFVGGANMFKEIKRIGNFKSFIISDKHGALISLYKALQFGWEPPKNITEQQYKDAKSYKDENPLKAFIGFGCSFAGKYFGGYARSGIRNYALNCYNGLKKLDFINTEIKTTDFMDLQIFEAVIYCDPPYKGTTKYSIDFDHELFWEKVRQLSKNNQVFVSEYTAPEDFKEVYRIETKLDMHSSSDRKERRIEKLFVLRT